MGANGDFVWSIQRSADSSGGNERRVKTNKKVERKVARKQSDQKETNGNQKGCGNEWKPNRMRTPKREG